MTRLIINTANDELFIVLQKDDKIFSKSINSKMHHNETMLPEIDALLKENSTSINQIDELGVVIGPGSFTGIRVGISTIKAFRDALKIKAKGINNLDYLFALAKEKDENVETVAIGGSRNSYFVARKVRNKVFKYERNLTYDELLKVSGGETVGVFAEDSSLNCLMVKQDARTLIDCFEKSADESLVPGYYQLSQAESEKLKKCQFSIRKACKKDVKEIFELEKVGIKYNAMTENQILDAVTSENYSVLKAVENGQIAGFVVLQKSDEINIDSIVVKKEYRNLGVASRLIKKAEKVAKDCGSAAIGLEVSENNLNAYMLYEKLGFVERRVRKKYYADGSDGIEMVKKV